MNHFYQFKKLPLLLLALIASACSVSNSDRHGATANHPSSSGTGVDGAEDSEISKRDVPAPTPTPIPKTKLSLVSELTPSREWIADSGEKFYLLGTFASEMMQSFRTDSGKDLTEVGTLHYTRNHTEYAAEARDGRPAISHRTSEHESSISVYLLKSRQTPDMTSLAVRASDSAEILNESIPVNVGIEFRFICREFSVPFVKSPLSDRMDIQPFTAKCDVQERCRFEAIKGIPLEYSWAEVQNILPATCISNQEITTKSLFLQNTSAVTAFEIPLLESASSKFNSIELSNTP